MRKTLFPGGQFAPAKVVNLVRRGVVSLNRQEVVNLTVFCSIFNKIIENDKKFFNMFFTIFKEE